MAIPFRCSSCGQEYPVGDDLAGRRLRCKFCGEVTRVVPPEGIGPVASRERATPSLHGPDLSALSDLEPPAAPPRATPQYGMDYIAPPPNLVKPAAPPVTPRGVPRPAPAGPAIPPPPLPLPRVAEVLPDAEPLPPVAPAAPMPAPAPLPRVAPSYAPPRTLPRSSNAGRSAGRDNPDEVWLLLSDDVARLISALLLVLMLAGSFYGSHKLVTFIVERANIPEELSSRFHTYRWFACAWAVLMFFVVIVPTLLAGCALACNWTKWTLPDRPYLRAAGTATLPYLLVFTVLLLGLNRQFAPAIGVVIISPFVLVIALKELMALRWSTTAVAALLLLVGMPVVGLITSPVSYFVNGQFQRYAGLDEKSIEQWMKDHPEEAKRHALNDPRFARENQPDIGSIPLPGAGGSTAGGGGGAGNTRPGGSRFVRPSPPNVVPTPRDPVSEKLQPIVAELTQLGHQSRTQTREQLQPAYDRLAGQVAALKPAAGEQSSRWDHANALLQDLERKVKDAPSETPPPEVFQPIAATAASTLNVPQAEAGEFVDDEFRFQNARIRPLKRLKVNVGSFLRGQTTQRWDLTSSASIELELQPVADPKQQRPWVADRTAIKDIAERKNLLAFVNHDLEPPQFGRIGDIGWTRLARASGERKHDIQYVGRLPDQWLIVRLKSFRPTESEIDALDKFVQGISYSTAAPTTAPSVAGTGAAGATPPAVKSSPPTAGTATVPVVAPAPGSGEINILLGIINGSGNSFDKRDALQKLSKLAPTDAAQRDVIAPLLEQLVVSDAAFIADDAADTLAVWWRPQTVDVLLPQLEERVWPPSKATRAMKVLGRTGDRRAAMPIMRWVLKDTEAVVAAMSALGPAGEDEAMARLREKDAAARAAAARILSAAGTQKCLIELRRAANDPRDAGAAATARSALETVLARVKQAKATTTSPAPAPPPAGSPPASSPPASPPPTNLATPSAAPARAR